MRPPLLCMALCFCWSASGASDSPLLDALDGCLPGLIEQAEGSSREPGRELARELARELSINRHCPAAAHAFAAEPYAAYLSKTTLEAATLHELHDIRGLLRAVREAAADAAPTLDRTALAEILSGLTPATVARPSWWERFTAWVKSLLRQEAQQQDKLWLLDWLERATVPPWLGDALYYIGAALVIALALLIVLNESRHSRFRFARRDKGRGGRVGLRGVAGHGNEPRLADIQHLPPGEQAAALFVFCISALVARGLLPDDTSLTHQELRRALAGEAELARPFGRIAQAAECAVYGGKPVAYAELALLRQSAARLSRCRPDA